MSHPKFAPITSSLLARKGSAAPSMMSVPRTPVLIADKHHAEPPLAFATAQHMEAHLNSHHEAALPHGKKLFVSLTHAEHERLAIAAVKTGFSRHHLVRDALDFYFEQLLRDMGGDCRCMAGACSGGCARA